MTDTIIDVKIENPAADFQVHITDNMPSNIIDKISNELHDKYGFNKICILTDCNVNDLYMSEFKDDNAFPLDDMLWKEGFQVCKIPLAAGEESKSWHNVIHILNVLEENNFTKNDLLIGFGGGIIGDITGFIAGIYKRGMHFITIPTTLLSMIDSCIGGKNAINGAATKNIAGTYYNPAGVYISTFFLKTLPQKEFTSSLGEVLKYQVISDFLSASVKNSTPCIRSSYGNLDIVYNVDLIEKVDFLNLYTDKKFHVLVYECLSIKNIFIERDFLDRGIRNILNLGHSIGHAIEVKSDFAISHGEAVSMGLYKSLQIAHMCDFIEKSYLDNFKDRANLFSLDVHSPYIVEELLHIMKNDKKNDDDIHLLLPLKDFGICRIRFSPHELIALCKGKNI